MNYLLQYTLEVYKRDGRCKGGEKLVGKYDYKDVSGTWMQEELADLRYRLYPRDKFRLECRETFVERRNAMSGELFWERYDIPYHCSPSSETYWSS
jgi:hypothetical protein